jgi:tripartite-type tricarboxylate transporter receptor subunit TctC
MSALVPAALRGSVAAGARQSGTPASCAGLVGSSVRWIVPYTVGGGYDVYSRLIAPFLEGEIGAAVSVDNVPGASGTIGARTLQRAATDGSTIGILHVTGLLVAAMSGSASAPHPLRDFTVLSRVAANETVWVTSRRARHRTLESILSATPADPVLFGATEVSSSNFVAMAVAAQLLGLNARFVAGLPGSRESSLALIRGDVDASAFTLESVLDRIEGGDLIPILHVAAGPDSVRGVLDGVPALAGADGLAARQARARGGDVPGALALADTLARLMGLGRVVAGPPGLDEAAASCLGEGLQRALTNPRFIARAEAARRRLDVLPGADTAAMIRRVAEEVDPIVAIVSSAIESLRG